MFDLSNTAHFRKWYILSTQIAVTALYTNVGTRCFADVELHSLRTYKKNVFLPSLLFPVSAPSLLSSNHICHCPSLARVLRQRSYVLPGRSSGTFFRERDSSLHFGHYFNYLIGIVEETALLLFMIIFVTRIILVSYIF